jgi:hypothetical protein
MQDDFDNGMGIPDDELAGESAMSEGDALGGHDGDVDLEAPESEPVGRASGGARAMSSGGAGKPAPRKAAAAKKKAPKKAVKKAAKKAKPARKAAKKSAPKKAAKKSAKKTAKKPAKRKAGKKK